MSTNDPNMIQLSLAAIAKMIKFDLSMAGTETIGLLIGREENGVVHVEDVRLGDQTGNAVHVQVSEAELTQAAIEISERLDDQVIVGWIHTHPGLSAFMSTTDISTQLLYQSLMPNAIAIVVDPTKYGETMDLNDLDMKVFRVEGKAAKECRYTIKKTVEFGLNTFVSGDSAVKVHSGNPKPRTYTVTVPTRDTIRTIRGNLQKYRSDLAEEDVLALEAWLELTEAIESGDVKEVPIEVQTLMDRLDSSLGLIDDEFAALRHEIEYRKDVYTLFAIFGGVFIEILVFFLFLF